MPEQCASIEDLFTRRDERPEVQQLLSNLKRDLPTLTALRDECHGYDGEDGVYRFYHGSFKVYWLQDLTERMVTQFKRILPEQTLNHRFSQIMCQHEATRPIVEAFSMVNCAAATARKRTETAEGIELQFATNVLGYFRLTRRLQAPLAAAAPVCVVNVASYWAGGLELTDLEFKRRRYDNDAAYRQSKQADRMLTVAFARRWRAEGISVNACHPGDVRSTLSGDLGFGGHETPEQGAATPVWLATTPVGVEETGQYFEHQRPANCRFGADLQAVDALYNACEGYD